MVFVFVGINKEQTIVFVVHNEVIIIWQMVRKKSRFFYLFGIRYVNVFFYKCFLKVFSFAMKSDLSAFSFLKLETYN